MLLIALLMTYMAHMATSSSCPCNSRDQVLSCLPNSIVDFPDDLADCTFDNDEIQSIQLFQQPLQQLNDNAFEDFINLKELMIGYCPELSTLSTGVFDGIPELSGLYIQMTNITQIPNGCLDNLTRLRDLFVHDNDLQSPYVTSAWHFCRRLDANNITLTIEGDLEVQKELSPSTTSDEYCRWRQHNGIFNPSINDKCRMDENSTYTCLTFDMAELACELQMTDFNEAIFFFPPSPTDVQDYGDAASNSFINEFNYQTKDLEFAKFMTTQRLYGTIIDLSEALRYTSSNTEAVYIHADTVWMSEPLTSPVHFDLIIRSRMTSINFIIPMIFTKDQLFEGYGSESNDVLERWAMKEEHVRMSDNLIVRVRKQGRVEILDALPGTSLEGITRHCNPYQGNITDYDGDISTWFDATSINLNYVGARTLQTSMSNDALLADMAYFYLNLVNDAKIVGEPRAFLAAQRFLSIQQMIKYPDAHNVPDYTLDITKELAEVMHDSLSEYRANEIQTEEELSSAKARATDMQLKFQVIEAQQKLYVDTEMEILDAIFTSVNESWHWSFEHRNAIKNQTDKAFDLIFNITMEMKQQEYQNLLSQAEREKESYQDTVSMYETQVGRWMETAESMLKHENELMDEMDVAQKNMEAAIDTFEENVEKWKHEQQVHAVMGVVKGVFEIGKGIATLILSPEASKKAVKEAKEGGRDIAESMEILFSVAETVDEIMAELEELEDIPLDDISLTLALNYSDSLANAIDMKESAPMFESIQLEAEYTLQDLKEAFPEIDGADNVQVTCEKVTNCGFRLIDAVSKFAYVMMGLSERQDELIVAQRDLERATDQVEEINEMIDHLQEQQEAYYENVEAARKAYEDEVQEYEIAFDQATEEEKEFFEEQITTLFDAFENTLNTFMKEYKKDLAKLMTSIQLKSFGLKDASMNQRAMTMTLFYDACDTLFYNSFHVCNKNELPMMSDDFATILDALTQIEWDTLADIGNLPIKPTNFDYITVLLQDDDERVDYPVKTLKETGSLSLNLKRYDPENRLDDFWRTRISKIRLTLLDVNGDLIPSPGITLGEEIYVYVNYPVVFNNTNVNGERFKFLAQTMYCNSDYITDRETGEPDFKRSCEVDKEFADGNYKTSPDGVFNFRLDNMDKIDIEKLATIKIEYSGSNIPLEHSS